MTLLRTVVFASVALTSIAGCESKEARAPARFDGVGPAIHEVVNGDLVMEAVPLTEGVSQPTLAAKLEEPWGTIVFRYLVDELPQELYAAPSVDVRIDPDAEAFLQARRDVGRSFMLDRTKIVEHFSGPGYASMVANEFLRVRATLHIGDFTTVGQVNVQIYLGETYVPVSHQEANDCSDPFGPQSGCHAGIRVNCPNLCTMQGVPTGDPACKMDCTWTRTRQLSRRTCGAAGGRCGPVMGGAAFWREDYAGTRNENMGGNCYDAWGFWDGCECEEGDDSSEGYVCSETSTGCNTLTSEGCESGCTARSCDL